MPNRAAIVTGASSGIGLGIAPVLGEEAVELLRAAGAEHRNALVVNTASISGKSGQPWLSVYSATKAAVIGFTQAIVFQRPGETL
jgi:short-subunit dehydrogenase